MDRGRVGPQIANYAAQRRFRTRSRTPPTLKSKICPWVFGTLSCLDGRGGSSRNRDGDLGQPNAWMGGPEEPTDILWCLLGCARRERPGVNSADAQAAEKMKSKPSAG